VLDDPRPGLGGAPAVLRRPTQHVLPALERAARLLPVLLDLAGGRGGTGGQEDLGRPSRRIEVVACLRGRLLEGAPEIPRPPGRGPSRLLGGRRARGATCVVSGSTGGNRDRRAHGENQESSEPRSGPPGPHRRTRSAIPSCRQKSCIACVRTR